MKLQRVESIQSFSHEGKVYLIFNDPLCKSIPDTILVRDTDESVIRIDNPYIHDNHHVVVVEYGNHFYVIPRIDDTRAVVIKIKKEEREK